MIHQRSQWARHVPPRREIETKARIGPAPVVEHPDKTAIGYVVPDPGLGDERQPDALQCGVDDQIHVISDQRAFDRHLDLSEGFVLERPRQGRPAGGIAVNDTAVGAEILRRMGRGAVP